MMAGDFNINHNLRHTDAFKELKQIKYDFNLTQLVKSNTGISRNSVTCIDLIFPNVNHIYIYFIVGLSRTQSVIMKLFT